MATIEVTAVCSGTSTDETITVSEPESGYVTKRKSIGELTDDEIMAAAKYKGKPVIKLTKRQLNDYLRDGINGIRLNKAQKAQFNKHTKYDVYPKDDYAYAVSMSAQELEMCHDVLTFMAKLEDNKQLSDYVKYNVGISKLEKPRVDKDFISRKIINELDMEIDALPRTIRDAIKKAISSTAGIDTSYGEASLKVNSPLYKVVTSKCETIVQSPEFTKLVEDAVKASYNDTQLITRIITTFINNNMVAHIQDGLKKKIKEAVDNFFHKNADIIDQQCTQIVGSMLSLNDDLHDPDAFSNAMGSIVLKHMVENGFGEAKPAPKKED